MMFSRRFWPDSRDFFAEENVEGLLHTKRAKHLFPLDAWWVKQGFDSGLVLIHRKSCAEQLQAVSRIARSTENVQLRNLSMGDKDIFHVVWMLHEKNFTLVPFIAESGSVQMEMMQRSPTQNKARKSRGNLRDKIGWRLSSQIKYGRDGLIYAVHQLHRQPLGARIATLSTGAVFHPTAMAQKTRYVPPLVIVRKDLRIARRIERVREGGNEFVEEIESALVRSRRFDNGSREELYARESMRILNVSRTPDWLMESVRDMNRLWGTHESRFAGVGVKRSVGQQRMRPGSMGILGWVGVRN